MKSFEWLINPEPEVAIGAHRHLRKQTSLVKLFIGTLSTRGCLGSSSHPDGHADALVTCYWPNLNAVCFSEHRNAQIASKFCAGNVKRQVSAAINQHAAARGRARTEVRPGLGQTCQTLTVTVGESGAGCYRLSGYHGQYRYCLCRSRESARTHGALYQVHRTAPSPLSLQCTVPSEAGG